MAGERNGEDAEEERCILLQGPPSQCGCTVLARTQSWYKPLAGTHRLLPGQPMRSCSRQGPRVRHPKNQIDALVSATADSTPACGSPRVLPRFRPMASPAVSLPTRSRPAARWPAAAAAARPPASAPAAATPPCVFSPRRPPRWRPSSPRPRCCAAARAAGHPRGTPRAAGGP